MAWDGMGWGWGWAGMVKWCEAKIHEIDGVFETAMDEGEGMGPCGLWGRRKKEAEAEEEEEEG